MSYCIFKFSETSDLKCMHLAACRCFLQYSVYTVQYSVHTVQCTGAKKDSFHMVFFFVKVVLTEAFDVVDCIDDEEEVWVVVLHNVLGGQIGNSWF